MLINTKMDKSILVYYILFAKKNERTDITCIINV